MAPWPDSWVPRERGDEICRRNAIVSRIASEGRILQRFWPKKYSFGNSSDWAQAIGADHLVRSSDEGKTWKPIGDPLPYNVFGTGNFTDLTYSAATKTFILYYADCGNAVLPDAIMSAGFDYAAQ
jgi:hypothetical protein